LSAAPPGPVLVELDVPARMRDGTVVRSDVYRPAGPGRYPVLLGRTTYGKRDWGRWIEPERTAAAGYAVVVNDMRGQFASDGELDPFRHDVADGFDVVEWCAAQPWSNGRVGMYGSSACGFSQLQAAAARPPHLRAIAPMQTWTAFGRGCVYDPGGAFSMYTQEWALIIAAGDPARRIGTGPEATERHQAIAEARHAIGSLHARLPIGELAPLPRELAPWYDAWLEQPDHDGWWADRDVTAALPGLALPGLHLVGWYDRFCRSTVANYVAMAAAGAPQKLVIGPWPHGVPVNVASGDRHVGPRGWVDARALVLRWYDRWLRDEPNSIEDEPPVRLYVLGQDAWRDVAAWPLPGTVPKPYYLRSGGAANSRSGDGVLSPAVPAADEPADRYVYDPADPTPSVPGRLARPFGSVDQGPIEDRPDVLVFSTPPLQADVDVIGPVEARLFAATSAVDTDWLVKLVDVAPDGRVDRLCEGMIRARYRESQAAPRLLEPDRVHEYRIDLGPIGNRFRAGHQIRVEVASASFPQFDRNMNTGGVARTETSGIPAVQTILHDAEHPSHVVLPIVPA
jgi:putative CocE/NonD family hydrolase